MHIHIDRHQGLIYMHVSILTKILMKRQKETCPGYQSWQWYICWNQYTCLYRGSSETFNFLNDNWYLNIRTPPLCVSQLLYYFMFMSIFTFYVILYSYLFSSLNRIEHSFLRISEYLRHSVFFSNNVSIGLQTLRDLLMLSSNIQPFCSNRYRNLRTLASHDTFSDLRPWSPFTDAESGPDSKFHWAYMGPIWGLQDPGGPHVGTINFAIWGHLTTIFFPMCPYRVSVYRSRYEPLRVSCSWYATILC